jgi:SAM-dependent methyltransferase
MTMAVESEPTIRLLRVEAARCSLFYRYVRLEILVHAEGDPAAVAAALHAELQFDGVTPPQSFHHSKIHAGGEQELVVDAMIDPARFPDAGTLAVTLAGVRIEIGLKAFAQSAFERNAHGALGRQALTARVDAMVAASPDLRPRLLDLGGRRRSGGSYSDDLAQCDVVVFDIVADEGVDVVGDAHELSRHFPDGHFDFVLSVSVFEHLLMPWKVALELNRVMRTGGYCYVHTHQTLGMHELPWDFWRYSNTVWNGLFNARTGFEIVETGLGHFMQLVTVGWNERYRGAEHGGGFESSGVLVRKTGTPDVAWDVSLGEVIATEYPQLR